MAEMGAGERAIWVAHKLWLPFCAGLGLGGAGVSGYGVVAGAPVRGPAVAVLGLVGLAFVAVGSYSLLALGGVVGSDHMRWYAKLKRQIPAGARGITLGH